MISRPRDEERSFGSPISFRLHLQNRLPASLARRLLLRRRLLLILVSGYGAAPSPYPFPVILVFFFIATSSSSRAGDPPWVQPPDAGKAASVAGTAAGIERLRARARPPDAGERASAAGAGEVAMVRGR
jgi:hypothetical protein